MTTISPRRAVIYTRISLDKSGEGLGVARQEEACRALAKARGWDVLRVFVENDTSASGKRPVYTAMLRAAKNSEFDIIVAWQVDRLTRSPLEIEHLIELADATGISVATVSGDLDLTTPNGRLVGRILGDVARGEVEQKAARQRAANRQRAEAGTASTGGARTLGYEGGMAKIRQSEAKHIRAGFQTVLAGGSLRSVARSWNAAGFTTTHGNRFDGTAVRTVLRNPRYAGIVRYDGDDLGRGKWTPLVSEEVYRAVGAILADPDRKTTPGRGRKHLGSGLFVCQCGSLVKSGATSTGVRLYRCARQEGHMARAAEPVDDYVGELMIGRLSRPDAVGLLASGEDTPDTEELKAEAAALRARLTELADLMVDGQITAAQLARGTERARARLAVIEGLLADAGRSSVLSQFIGSRDLAAAKWRNADLDVRRAAIDLLMSVTLYSPGRGMRKFDPDSVQITWK